LKYSIFIEMQMPAMPIRSI